MDDLAFLPRVGSRRLNSGDLQPLCWISSEQYHRNCTMPYAQASTFHLLSYFVMILNSCYFSSFPGESPLGDACFCFKFSLKLSRTIGNSIPVSSDIFLAPNKNSVVSFCISEMITLEVVFRLLASSDNDFVPAFHSARSCCLFLLSSRVNLDRKS